MADQNDIPVTDTLPTDNAPADTAPAPPAGAWPFDPTDPPADETGSMAEADSEPTPAEPAAEEPAADETGSMAEADSEPTPAEPAAEEPAADESRTYGAQFSSPEPTTVTARPRRRATRPVLTAETDTVEPPTLSTAAIPAFITFVAPDEIEAAEALPPRRRSRRTGAESPAESPAQTPAESLSGAEPTEPGAEEDAESGSTEARRGRSRRRAVGDAAAEDAPSASRDDGPTSAGDDRPADAPDDGADDGDRDDEDGTAGSRRRRRGRRGRGRGRSGEDGGDTERPAADSDDEDDVVAIDDEDGDTEDENGDGATSSRSSTRRRRRRRRRGEDGDVEDAATGEDRPERAGRNGRVSSDDDVRGVSGSTRLEAKRQRRRDGRDGGRRRTPILSESEFLARREAVDRTMVIRQRGERTQIAVLEDDILVEHYVTQAQSESYAGNVYLGRVQNVLPSMEAAFVDIGKGRNAVLYAGEVNWDAAGLSGKSRSIEQALSSGSKVLAQVTKDPMGHKGARLTQQINLPGRFLVFVPGSSMTGISRKLPDNERQRLKDILKKIVPDDAGVIIRTAAEGASEEELTRDVARLQAQWEVISKKAESVTSAPALLYDEPDLAIRVIRDVFNEDFAKLVVQGDEEWDTVEAYVGHVSPELAQRLSRYTGEGDVFADLRVDEQLAKALDRKVWLPSGGSLVIDRTEAMTVVDVNTGKFTGSGGNLEQTVTRNNIEAAEEIVRQLRLRDIGGMIVIDFIDMVLESNRDLVLRRLTECLGRDRTKHQVAEVTSLGLVQMTRKRVGQGLLEVFSEPCEHCRGRGVLVRTDPVDEKRRQSFDGGSGAGFGGGRRDPGRSGSRSESRPEGRPDAKPDAKPEVQAAAEPEMVGAAGGPSVGEEPDEGSAGGRRGRGRRNRGSSAGMVSDESPSVGPAEPSEPSSEPAAPSSEPSESSSVEPSFGSPSEQLPADDAAAGLEYSMQPAAQAPGDEVLGDEPPGNGAPARPRRRRAASRPAGPPA